jgi:hypothetical protein
MVRKISIEKVLSGSPLVFVKKFFEETEKSKYLSIVLSRTQERLAYSEDDASVLLKFKELENKYLALLQ